MSKRAQAKQQDVDVFVHEEICVTRVTQCYGRLSDRRNTGQGAAQVGGEGRGGHTLVAFGGTERIDSLPIPSSTLEGILGKSLGARARCKRLRRSA